jgi:hypothetical protein
LFASAGRSRVRQGNKAEWQGDAAGCHEDFYGLRIQRMLEGVSEKVETEEQEEHG